MTWSHLHFGQSCQPGVQRKDSGREDFRSGQHCRGSHKGGCAAFSHTVVADACDPADCGPPGSSVHGSLQARILEGVARPSSRGSSRPRDRTQFSSIAGGFFTVWATREDPCKEWQSPKVGHWLDGKVTDSSEYSWETSKGLRIWWTSGIRYKKDAFLD